MLILRKRHYPELHLSLSIGCALVNNMCLYGHCEVILVLKISDVKGFNEQEHNAVEIFI